MYPILMAKNGEEMIRRCDRCERITKTKKEVSILSNSLMNKNITNISGVTLIEILMGVVISIVMMAAMFTPYNVVNNTYSKVTDTAKMSQALTPVTKLSQSCSCAILRSMF